MATKTRNPETSTVDTRDSRVPETLHPGLHPHRPTTHQPPEKGDHLPMDRRPHPAIVLTDHNTLQYWRHPQGINRHITRYLLRLADYDVQLKHQLGVTNKANHLSRRPDYDQGTNDNQEIMALPERLFANVLNLATLQEDVRQSQ